jgi:RimJ/RimL family protein N-acetyltransferase
MTWRIVHNIATGRWYSFASIATADRCLQARDPISGETRVNVADIHIRQLTPADAAVYRGIRLEGLNRSPEAFGSTFEAEFSKPLAWFFDRLISSQVFGAFHGPEILGIAGFAGRQGEKEAHKGLLWGMYVRPEARGAGVAGRLVEAVIDVARGRVELIQLSVVVGNERARRLYARLGFVEYGIERNSLKYNGKYYDEILMAMDLVSNSDHDTVHLPCAGAALGSDGSASSIALASPSSG